MMRRLTSLVPAFLLALIVGGLLTFCSLATVARHTAEAKAQGQNCSTACGSHGQPAAISSQKENKDDDDKEPTPPQHYWQLQPINLSLLYTAPILAFVPLGALFRKHLLSTQLRF